MRAASDHASNAATPLTTDATAAAETLAPRLYPVARLLADDSATWAADLAGTAQRLTEWARDVPQRAPSARPAPQLPPHATRDPMRFPVAQPPSLKGNSPVSSAAARLGAAIAAIVVIALFGALFYMHNIHTSTARISPAAAVHTPTTFATGTTPGAAARYVSSAVTARGVDKQSNPVGVTSHFTVGDTVYVVVRVTNTNVTPGTTNTLAIAWYLNGHPLGQTGMLELRIPPQPTATFNAYFSLPYMQSGLGMAKIYWNPPPNDPRTDVTDPALAQTITFVVAN